MLTSYNFALIHRALHAGKEIVILDGKEHLFIKPPGKNYRMLDYGGFRIMKQNPSKESKYAKRARNGEKITWGIRDGEWAYIEGEEGKELTNIENIQQ